MHDGVRWVPGRLGQGWGEARRGLGLSLLLMTRCCELSLLLFFSIPPTRTDGSLRPPPWFAQVFGPLATTYMMATAFPHAISVPSFIRCG